MCDRAQRLRQWAIKGPLKSMQDKWSAATGLRNRLSVSVQQPCEVRAGASTGGSPPLRTPPSRGRGKPL